MRGEIVKSSRLGKEPVHSSSLVTYNVHNDKGQNDKGGCQHKDVQCEYEYICVCTSVCVCVCVRAWQVDSLKSNRTFKGIAPHRALCKNATKLIPNLVGLTRCKKVLKHAVPVRTRTHRCRNTGVAS